MGEVTTVDQNQLFEVLCIEENVDIYKLPRKAFEHEESNTSERKNLNPRFKKSRDEQRREIKIEDVNMYGAPTSKTRKKTFKFRDSKKLMEIKKDRKLFEEMEKKLSLYKESKDRKFRIIERDQNEFLFKPIESMLKKAMCQESYQRYKEDKLKAVERADLHPVPIRSSRNPSYIPTIRISNNCIRDIHLKYKEKREKDIQLSNVINKAFGFPLEEDLPSCARETDFQKEASKLTDKPRRVKQFPNRFECSVKHEISHF